MTAQLALLALANEAQKTLYKTNTLQKALFKENASSTEFASLSLNLGVFRIILLVNSVGFAR